ncbi:MAG: asparagine synthase (glutamine-hydrolyzing) [Janthinobacterium lividum]
MCGIAGLLQPNRRSLQRDEAMRLVERMNACIAHRGPDADGVWADADGRCILGQRRLSIIDTSDAGRQPFCSSDGRWWITFNGEIYNFGDVRAELQRAGVHFRGRTDTEVLVEAIALWGIEALARLDGMFAFVAYDTQTRTLLAARDPFGEKPLYYTSLASGVMAFASELQALEGLPGFDRSLNVDSVAEVLSFQYVGAPRSIYAGTKKLPPGHWMRINADGEIQIQRYFRFQPGIGGLEHRPMADLADELEELLTVSLKRRLFADVPLGAFLSGGVDSSTVCALVTRKLKLPLHTFSMGFEGSPESEHEIARLFAAHLGTDHHDQLVDPHGTDFLRNIGKVLDEPNADSSCLPTYLLSGFARQHVTVALSGDGGDELFGGYGRYFATLDESERKAAGELPDYKAGATYYGNRILVSGDDHLQDLFGFMPPGFAAHVGHLRGQLDNAPHGQLLARMRQQDAAHYMPGAVLPKVDRMSMQHGLEVRTPFLNVALARFAERLPDDMLVSGDRGKLILREVAYRYLPRDLIDMPKKGFGLPMSDWARGSLLNLASELLGADSRLTPLFGRDGLTRFLERQKSPHGFSTYQLWAVLMLESWLRHHPATVPDLTDRRPARPVPSGYGALWASQVAETVWLVDRGDPDRAPDVDRGPGWRLASPTLKNRVVELVSAGKGCVSETAHVRLPDWGVPLPGDFARSTAALKGATLAFLDPEAEGRLDYHELAKLGAVGVARIAFVSRFVTHRVHEIDLNAKSLPRRILDTALLAVSARGLVTNRRAFRPLRARSFEVREGASCISPEMPGLPVAPDTDAYDRVMVFEGLRQLPPLLSAHGEIGHSDSGRYSIWNRRLYFSPTARARLYTHPLWFVDKTEANTKRLQFAQRTLHVDVDESETFNFSGLYEDDARHAGAALAPGDKVVVCTHGLAPGGAERQWIYLALGLKRAGYEVHFVIYNEPTGDNAHYLPLIEASGVSIHVVDRQSPLALLKTLADDPRMARFVKTSIIDDVDRFVRLVAVLRRVQPKTVFAQLDDPNIYAGFASLLADVPRVVVSFRNYNPSNFPYIYKPWYRQAYAMMAKSGRVSFTGNFAGANRDYEAWIGMADGRTFTIPNAVSVEGFPMPDRDAPSDLRRDLHIASGEKVVLGVFRLSAEKNPLLFLDVCLRLIEADPQTRVLLVGVGPLMSELEEAVARRGMTDRFTFLGRRDDVNALMAVADLLLLTSDREGMPNVVLEAQLMGLPVVATDAGGTRDAMVPGDSGFLCPTGDADALVAACRRLLEDPDAARRMGEAGARHARTDFSIATMAERYAAVAGAVPVQRPEPVPA